MSEVTKVSYRLENNSNVELQQSFCSGINFLTTSFYNPSDNNIYDKPSCNDPKTFLKL